ncbi:MAG: hypothetical protein KKD44_24655 [Proteobacteria bacterium]|nr:hypothetical protein [Pseudomonadota bacterium]
MTSLKRKRNEKNTHTVKRSLNLYQLIEAVDSEVEPGEKDMVPFIVSHILSSYNATLRTH